MDKFRESELRMQRLTSGLDELEDHVSALQRSMRSTYPDMSLGSPSRLVKSESQLSGSFRQPAGQLGMSSVREGLDREKRIQRAIKKFIEWSRISIETLVQEKSELNDRYVSEQHNAAKLSSELKQAVTLLGDVHEEMRSFKSQYEQRDEECMEVTQQLQLLSTERDTLHKLVEEYRSDIHKLYNEKHELAKEATAKSTEAQEAQLELVQLQSLLESSRQEQRQQQQTVFELEHSLRSTRNQLQEHAQLLREARTELSLKQEQVDELRAENKRLVQTLDDTRVASVRFSPSASERQELQLELNVSNRNAQALMIENDELKKLVDKQTQQIQVLIGHKQNSDNLTRQLVEMERELARCKREASSANRSRAEEAQQSDEEELES